MLMSSDLQQVVAYIDQDESELLGFYVISQMFPVISRVFFSCGFHFYFLFLEFIIYD